MARESIITILRSLSADTPTGLTFGELGFAGASRKLFIGGTGGGATVESVWIGASITGESLSNIGNGGGDLWGNLQDSNNTLSTSKAVKTYIDSVVGTAGVVSSVNGDIGAITITGAAGGTGAIVVRRTGEDTHIIDARIATNSLTGVASFTNGIFSVTNGAVNLESNTLRVRGSDNSTFDSTIIENYTAQDPLTLTITGSAGIYTSVTEGVDAGRNNNPQVTIYHTGVFSSGLSATGITANSVFANSIVGTNASFASGITFSGTVSGAVKSVNGNDGIVTITGSSNDAAVVVRSSVAGTHRIDARMASLTVTGVASFDTRHFALGASGHVSLTGSYQVTGDTVVAGNSISVSRSNNQATITNAGVTGITSGTVTYGNIGTNGIFLSGTTGNISIQNTGVRSLSVQGSGVTADWYQKGPRIEGDGYNINVVGSYDNIPAGSGPYLRISSSGLYSLNGLTSGSSVNGPFFTITGDSGAIRAVNDSNTASIIFVPRIATSSLTGVASFDPRHFALGVSGHVSLTGPYQATGDTVVAGNSILVVRSNNQATITNMGVTGIGFGNDTGLTGKINLTGSAITVLGNTITFTSGSGGVPSVNGDATAITITGSSNDAAVVVRSSVAGIHRIDARIATTTGLTGVASFHPGHFTVTNGNVVASFASGVTFNGVSVFSSGLSATGITANSVFTNRFSATNASFSSGVTFNGTVSGAVKSFNGNDGVVTITGAGQGLGQAIKVTSTVAGTHLIDARLASYTLTGVAYFDPNAFIVDEKGYIQLNGGGGGPCSDYTSQGTCVSNGCVWCDGVQECVQQFCSGPLFTPNGIGASANANGSLAYLYFDPASLTAYTGTYDSKKLNYVLIYDNDETGLVKAKRASIQNFFAENFGLITSSTLGQLTNASKKTFGDELSLEIGVVLGNVAAGQEGLVKGASAFAYIETNTVRSFNGLTGAVTAVGSINGCTAAVVITGSASEIEVLNTCPNIVIGLPDNVTISNLNVLSGATFGGNISAKNIVTSVNGATGPITNVAKTDVNNEFASAQTFNSNVLVSDSIITVYDSAVEHSIILSPSTDRIRFYDDGFGNSLDLYAGGNFNNQVIDFPGSNTTLAGLAVSQTFTDTNTFNSLTIFASGLSASGATFANDIKVNGVNIGLGGGNVASNLGIGKGALTGNSGGLFNTAVGSGAMEIGTNSYSVAFGFNALHSCTGGGINNVALGSNTMATISSASSNVAIGSNSSQQLIDGNFNISIGGESLANNANGSSNLAIGHQALYANSTSNNIGIGYQALYTNDEGQQNTAIGYEALKSITTTGSAERNTAIGYQAGRWRGTGTSVISNRLNSANDSIFIGWRARSSADAQTNQIVIGNNTLGGGSNTTTIGTTASTDATIYGKLHGTNGVSGPTASFTSLTVSENTTLGSTASNTTTIYGAKIVNESIYSNGTLRNVGINFANGQVQTLTGIGTGATGTTAIYFTGAPATGAGNVTLLVTNGGSMTGNTTTWEGRIKWPGGVKPTLSTTGIDVVSFVTPDAGTTIYGFLGGLNFS